MSCSTFPDQERAFLDRHNEWLLSDCSACWLTSRCLQVGLQATAVSAPRRHVQQKVTSEPNREGLLGGWIPSASGLIGLAAHPQVSIVAP